MRGVVDRARTLFTLSSLSVCAGGCAPAQHDAPYVSPDIVDMTRLLAPPPSDPSALEHDIQAVRAARSARLPDEPERAAADSPVDVFLFADVLGENFTADRLPITAAFFDKVNREFLAFLRLTKDCWRRPRPFEVDATVEPSAALLASAVARPGTSGPPRSLDAASPCVATAAATDYSYAYPSGHATFGAITAILLAESIPERRAELFARGWEYGDARVVGGVHFPSDLEAGRILATVLVALMMQNERFRADLADTRAELRSVLGFER